MFVRVLRSHEPATEACAAACWYEARCSHFSFWGACNPRRCELFSSCGTHRTPSAHCVVTFGVQRNHEDAELDVTKLRAQASLAAYCEAFRQHAGEECRTARSALLASLRAVQSPVAGEAGDLPALVATVKRRVFREDGTVMEHAARQFQREGFLLVEGAASEHMVDRMFDGMLDGHARSHARSNA